MIPRPTIRFFELPQAMRPATCDVCGAEATVLVQENVPGGIFHRICRPCYLDFTSTHDPLPEEPAEKEPTDA